MKYTMQLISRDELKRKLEREDQFKLVMALGDWEYRAKHIPGSLHFLTPQEALASLAQDDEIVVYCSNSACPASAFAYEYLVHHGYKHVRRYAGGILDWEEAGYPLEGEMVAAKTP
ncbi:MAG TPA: rhodanese-like domain-containing protein [Ktedonobacteraceae bacterium]|nr:rhodanese-like domain-containing protein [Ktedonobacteraceae bacterium]